VVPSVVSDLDRERRVLDTLLDIIDDGRVFSKVVRDDTDRHREILILEDVDDSLLSVDDPSILNIVETEDNVTAGESGSDEAGK